MNEELKIKILDFCLGLGLDTVGFISCRDFTELEPILQNRKKHGLENQFEERDIQKRVSPNLFMEEGKTIISIAFPYLYSTEEPKGEINFSSYTYGEDYHKVVEKYLGKICGFIEGLGGKAKSFVDSNALPERYIAKLAGIGHIGKNQMLITKKYGSYVFLGEIITDLKLEPSKVNNTGCGKCSLCIKSCPSNAITENGCNPNLCLSYITQKKELEAELLFKLEGRLFGCDTCQAVCPKNFKLEFSPIEEFKPFEFMVNPDLEEIFNMNNNTFKEKYKNTSCGWRGKALLQRNVLLNLFSKGEGQSINFNNIKSSYVKEYYHRLFKLMKL